MNRRDVIAALPAAGAGLALASHALAQPPAATAPRPVLPPAPPLTNPSTLPMDIVAEGLKFPEAPVYMKDGSIIFVEIERQTISRLPAGKNQKVEVLADLPGGPNGLAIGPDGMLYIANDGGRFSFTVRDGENYPGAISKAYKPGKIHRMDLKTRKIEVMADKADGKPMIAPDDLLFDHQGNLWITEYGLGREDGGLYFLAKGATEAQWARKMPAPNGVGLSPDGKLLHISSGTNLFGFDVTGPGKLETVTYPNNGIHSPLTLNSTADSLKVMANGDVAVCSLSRPGGVGVHNKGAQIEFFGFGDRMTCNLVFGGRDMRDCWVMLSGKGQIAKVRWPRPGLKAAFYA
jgi:gluconolactonase